jgi:hypothetical protein
MALSRNWLFVTIGASQFTCLKGEGRMFFPRPQQSSMFARGRRELEHVE